MQSAIHVFYEREKIAEHTINQGIHQDMCLDEHMSPEHLAQKGLSKDEIIFWANRMGLHTSQYVNHILSQKRDLAKNIKSLNKFREWVVDKQKSHCSEPYRVCRRLNILRDYSDEKTNLYPRN